MMTGNTQEALDRFNAQEDLEQTREAFDDRMKFVEKVHSLLKIALDSNREQYGLLQHALETGKDHYDFDYYVRTSDWDEKVTQIGYHYQPAALIRMVKRDDVDPQYQASQTKQMLLAVPLGEDVVVTDTTAAEDLELENIVYVYWTIEDVNGTKEECYEVSANGVRRANFVSDSMPDSDFAKMVELIGRHDFSTLETGASLVARFRQDLRNLKLVPQISEPVSLKNVIQ